MYFLDNAFTLELGKPEYFRVFAIDLLRFFQAPLFCLPLTLKAAEGVPFLLSQETRLIISKIQELFSISKFWETFLIRYDGPESIS